MMEVMKSMALESPMPIAVMDFDQRFAAPFLVFSKRVGNFSPIVVLRFCQATLIDAQSRLNALPSFPAASERRFHALVSASHTPQSFNLPLMFPQSFEKVIRDLFVPFSFFPNPKKSSSASDAFRTHFVTGSSQPMIVASTPEKSSDTPSPLLSATKQSPIAARMVSRASARGASTFRTEKATVPTNLMPFQRISAAAATPRATRFNRSNALLKTDTRSTVFSTRVVSVGGNNLFQRTSCTSSL